MLSRPVLVVLITIASLAALVVLVRSHRRHAGAAAGSGRQATAGPQQQSHPPSISVLYEGSIPVAGNAYQHTELVGNDYAEIDIPGLDTVVRRAASLTFTLNYPFDEPFQGRVVGVEGITLRHVIDAVRDGYQQVYEEASVDDIPNLGSTKVKGTYAAATHVIDDLAIERIPQSRNARLGREQHRR